MGKLKHKLQLNCNHQKYGKQTTTVSLVTTGLQVQHTESLKQRLDTFAQPLSHGHKFCVCVGVTEAAVSVGILLLPYHLSPSLPSKALDFTFYFMSRSLVLREPEEKAKYYQDHCHKFCENMLDFEMDIDDV